MNTQILIQITSGRGPAECQRAVAHMLRFLTKEAQRQGWNCDLVEAEAGPREKDCLLSALVEIEASLAETAKLRTWAQELCGSHLWVCRSPFRTTHARKNWFFGVSLLPSVDEIRLDPREVVFEACRASGPGGQHVNKTDSAIRARWLPGGLVAQASGERSQSQNRRVALARLQALVDARNAGNRDSARQQAWQEHNELERGQALLKFTGEEFRRC